MDGLEIAVENLGYEIRAEHLTVLATVVEAQTAIVLRDLRQDF